ncbi:hypothetical protein LPC10_01645 [Methylorubrum sp. B1-46]|uniref:hypothetical protein n=1 Tax=Methylorubrum sp. B1-46 TaxID=2897334 RepID=UPI001E3794D0|nr:hypothetical protein [Methylorubrum sp. B1-46]UGB26343.1 hypothetical protein LPC10_01645 [Methylorubrum sp. B1-46]
MKADENAAPTAYIVPVNVLAAIEAYLSLQPFREVEGLIAILRSAEVTPYADEKPSTEA